MSILTPKKDDENLGSFYMGRMRPPPEPKRVMPKGALTIVALLAFAAIIYAAYPSGQEKYSGLDVPVITADKETYKFTPDDPGGMEVRHQDSTVFAPLEKANGKEVEKLLPNAEEPLDKKETLGEKVKLDEKSPKLNLDLQMKEVAAGTEKVISKADAKKAEVLKLEPAKDSKKEELKKEIAKEDAKAEEKSEEKVAAAPVAAVKTEEASPAKLASGFYMQLGSYRDITGAKTDWAMLQKKYPQFLKGLSMKTEKVDLAAKGVWTRLYAGPLSEGKARETCASLKTLNPSGGCIVAKK